MSYDVEGDSMSRWFEILIQKITPDTSKPIIVFDPQEYLQIAELQQQLKQEGYNLIFTEPGIMVRMKYECEVRGKPKTMLVISGEYDLVDDMKDSAFVVELKSKDLFRNFDENAIKGLNFSDLNKIDSIPLYKELSYDETVDFLNKIHQEDEINKAENLKQTADNMYVCIKERLKSIEDLYSDWFDIASDLGELGYCVYKLCDKEILAKYNELLESVNTSFQIFVSKKYDSLFSMSGLRYPVTIDKDQDYIAANTKGLKAVLIVIDGMNYWQWKILKHKLESYSLTIDEKTTLSWLPSITALARQSIFSGKKPNLSIDNRNEGELFKKYWIDNQQKLSYQILYKSIKTEQKIEIPSSDIMVAGFVINALDEMMHGTILGYEQLFINTELWIEKSDICTSIKKLRDEGYKVYISTDHGNIDAELNLRLTAGQKTLIHSRSKRFIQFDTEKQAELFIEENSNCNLGRKDNSVYFKDNHGFGAPGENLITHGGSHILELLIPIGVVQ